MAAAGRARAKGKSPAPPRAAGAGSGAPRPAKRRAPPRKRAAKAPPAEAPRLWPQVRWLLLRLAVVYLFFNLGLNVVLGASQPLRPLRLLTLDRIDERLDAAGLLLRHYIPTHTCEGQLSRPELEELATAIAGFHGVEPALLMAVADAESGFRAHAISPVGAVGLTQLMPSTARWIDVPDPFNPRDNLDGSARYLKSLLASFRGDLDLSIAAYNAGPGTVRRYGGIPPWPETRAYVRRVNARLTHYRSLAMVSQEDRATR